MNTNQQYPPEQTMEEQGPPQGGGGQQPPPGDYYQQPWMDPRAAMPHYPPNYPPNWPPQGTPVAPPPPPPPYYYPPHYGYPPQPMPGQGYGMEGAHPESVKGASSGISQALGDIVDSSGLGALKGWLDLEDGEFWKGAIVGAAAVLLITNDSLRDSLLGGASKTAEAMKAGLAGLGPNGDEADQGVAGQEQPEQEAEK